MCKSMIGRFTCIPLLILSLLAPSLLSCERVTAASQEMETSSEEEAIDTLLKSLSLEQKISQMIMPSIRTWNEENVTDLSKVPELAEVLARHPYGGIILFGSNVESTEQTFNLIQDLQLNNMAAMDSETPIPYLISADQEGGIVCRLSMGTRGTGSMALGAAGEKGEENAYITGKIFGEELSALGINVNLAPCVDVILDPADQGISTRVFSDDPEVAARLGAAFARGVGESDVITTYKHFPGAGDGSDDPTSIPLSLEEMEKNGLLAFQTVIQEGAEMVMIAATTFPLIDEPQLMADGATKGYYPATLSPRIVTELLRQKLGFEGVVITDALEMEQFVTEPDTKAPLFSGEAHSLEHDLQIAQKAILAGCDILLLPKDLITMEAAEYYDGYIQGLVSMAEEGSIPVSLIDAAVKRILSLKASRQLLTMDSKEIQEQRQENLEKALATVGSPEHHALEFDLAKDAITLLRNEGEVLPLSPEEGKYLILAFAEVEHDSILYALRQLKEKGVLDGEAYIEDRFTGTSEGSQDSPVSFLVDTYRDMDSPKEGEPSRSEMIRSDIQDCRAVICFSKIYTGMDLAQDDNPRIQEQRLIRSWAGEAQVPFILLSESFPADITRFQDADAIVCAYLASRAGREDDTIFSGSANVPTALYAIFGEGEMSGSLPMNIPVLEQKEDGSWAFGEELLYERGYSLPLPSKQDQ